MISPALNYLRAREWASWYDEPGPLDLCTECGALRLDGHQPECQMRAAIGVFVTLAPPTKPMLTEAVGEGFYVGGNGKKYPKIQIITVAELLAKSNEVKYPDVLTSPTFKVVGKKAPAKKKVAKGPAAAGKAAKGAEPKPAKGTGHGATPLFGDED